MNDPKSIGMESDDIEWLSTPVGFAEGFLGMSLYQKQKDAIAAFGPIGSRVSFASANGCGKTAMVAPAVILWHQFMFPQGRFAITSGKFSQIEEQLMPALWWFKKKFPSWRWYDSAYFETEQGGFFTGFSSKHAGYVEGFHDRGDDVPLAILVDECKSAPVWLESVVEGRINPNRLMLMSSHGFAEGWFFNSHTKDKKDYQCIVQTAYDCPHISADTIEKVRRRWGATGMANSILGLGFLNLVENSVIDYKSIDHLLSHPPETKYGEIHAFMDPAWSGDGDEATLCVRNGNVVKLEAVFREEGLHAVCDRYVKEFKRLGLESKHLSIDEGGGGQLIADELDRRGWRVQRWNNGAAANDSEHFQDSKAEVWFNAGELIDMGKIIMPDDEELRFQLINRKRKPGTLGRLAVETKSEMRERGVGSPDRADSFVGCLMPKGGWHSGGVTKIKAMQVGTYQPLGV